jgi:Ca-activated chloride channel family protein
VICSAKVPALRHFLATAGLLAAIASLATILFPADVNTEPLVRVNVDLVTVTFNVTDSRGNHVTALKPDQVRITEDGIAQKMVLFKEAGQTAMRLSATPAEGLSGTSIFVLFDTSNGMYKGFSYASDAIAEFVRHLDQADSVAVYSFSRNLSRMATLTKDHNQAIYGLRNTVAGDDTALYNTLLLTLRDAAKVTGRKAVVVFSNGPDNASVISPDDVRAVAEDEGIPIYVISTEEGRQDSISTSVFERLTALTGGRLYWARDWQKQAQAFASVRDDIGSSYTVAYYPAPNSNEGFRNIRIEIVPDIGKKYRVRARVGYRSRGAS